MPPEGEGPADPELPDVGSGPEDALAGASPPGSALLLRELVFEGAGRLPFVAPAFGVAFDDVRAGALLLAATFDEAGIALPLALSREDAAFEELDFAGLAGPFPRPSMSFHVIPLALPP